MNLQRFLAGLATRPVAGRSAASLQAEGLALLVQARSRQPLDRAVECLAAARHLAGRSAPIAADLAAAHLVAGERSGDARQLVAALSSSREALRLDPRLPAARFNLALALDALHLPGAATVAWRGYLEVDKDSGFAGEAREHLVRLQMGTAVESWPAAREGLRAASDRGDGRTVAEVVNRFPQASQLLVEEEILPRWGAALIADGGREGSREERSLLDLTRRIGAALRERGGDSFLADVSTSIAPPGGRHGDRRRLASALRDYGLGVAAYKRNEMAAAGRLFQAASAGFRAAGSSYGALAELYLAILRYQRGDDAGALERLGRIAADRTHRSHRTLLARVSWTAGLCDLALGRPLEAIAGYRSALADFASLGNTESATAMHGMLASALDLVGDPEQAWQHRLVALAGATSMLSPRRRAVLYAGAAQAARALGEPLAAGDFQDEAVSWARRSGNPLDAAEALRQRAALAVDRGDDNLAMTDLSAARTLGGSLESPLRTQVMAEIEATEALAQRHRRPALAVARGQAAVRLFQQTAYKGRLPAAYLDLAVSQRAAGDERAAQASVAAGIAAASDEWRHLLLHLGERGGGEPWSGYFDRGQELFDLQVALLASAGQVVEAFESSETAHAWELALQLLDLPELPRDIARTVDLRPPPFRLAALQSALPPHTVLLEYRVLPEGAWCWVVRRDGIRQRDLGVRRDAIAAQTRRLRDSLAARRSGGELLSILGTLRRELLAPLEADLRRDDELVIVPDRTLADLPFAALWDGVGSRFLVEDFALGISPSAAAHVRAVRHDRKLERTSAADAAAICNPAFSPDLFPDLAPLPGAEAECADLTRIYPGAESIVGEAATRQRFLDALAQHGVVHVAAHTMTSGQEPLTSVLALAAGSADDGVLYAYQLVGRRLPLTRLVVFASCAAAEGARGGGGLSGFVRPLLAGGVPAVLGTLWSVDDQATTSFFRTFYTALRSGQDALHALRAAQVVQIRGGARDSDPWQWAGFQLFGGVSPARAR